MHFQYDQLSEQLSLRHEFAFRQSTQQKTFTQGPNPVNMNDERKLGENV